MDPPPSSFPPDSLHLRNVGEVLHPDNLEVLHACHLQRLLIVIVVLLACGAAAAAAPPSRREVQRHRQGVHAQCLVWLPKQRLRVDEAQRSGRRAGCGGVVSRDNGDLGRHEQPLGPFAGRRLPHECARFHFVLRRRQAPLCINQYIRYRILKC